MARLIDAGELKWCKILKPCMSEMKSAAIREIDINDIPTVDAVQVVRCRDCKHWNISTDKTTTWCTRLRSVETIKDDFCSFGERRD